MRGTSCLSGPFFAAVALLAACGGVQVPTCPDGQALGVLGGSIVCRDAAPQQPPLPTCDPASGALTTNGQSLRCTSRTSTVPVPPDLEDRVSKLQEGDFAASAALQGYKDRASPGAVFVGVTKESSRGWIQAAGASGGLPAAAQLCGNNYPGSHMCTPYELYNTVTAGLLTAADSIPMSFIYLPGWNMPAANPEDPYAGLADNCASYTDFTGYRNHRGTAVEWTLLPTGQAGFKFHGGDDVHCYNLLPIACCR